MLMLQIIYVYECFASMCRCELHVYLVKRQQRDTGYLGSQTTDGCKLPCECWTLNPGLLLE